LCLPDASNGVCLNNVNACGDNGKLLSSPVLANVSRNLAPAFRRWGVTPYLSVCYASPHVLDNVTSDPHSAQAAQWWAQKASELWAQWPEFGGFVVKADSEGNQGPEAFNATVATRSSDTHDPFYRCFLPRD
jgi:alpha-glucuronidase